MRILSKIILVATTIILTSFISFGQRAFTLKGQIMDGSLNEPLMAAAVSIKGEPVGTATDFDGKYSFLIKEKYWNDTIVVSMLGFLPYIISVEEASKLPNQTLSVTLQETAFQLDMAEIGAPIILRNIFFEFNKHQLLPTSFPELEKLYNYLQKNEKVVIEVAGHTDSIGTEIYNEALSEARASAVIAYLEEKGIDQNRMTAKGYGESRPVVSNELEQGRAMNRRVEFTVLSKGEILNTSQMPDTTVLNEVVAVEESVDKDTTIILRPPVFEEDTETKPIIITADTDEVLPKIGSIAGEDDVRQKIHRTVAEYGIEKSFNGVVCVYKDNEILYEGGSGFADLSNTMPNVISTQFFMGELTEQFTNVLIFKALKTKKVDLDLPIGNYLNNLPKVISERVTVRQLMTHSSGICQGADLTNLDLCFLPNATQNYSEANFILLGKILEKIYNDSYRNIVEKQIINPLNLSNTKLYEPFNKSTTLAKGYHKSNDRLIEVPVNMDFRTLAANGVITTVGDLLLWQKALKNNEWLAIDLQVLMSSRTQGNQTFAGEIVQLVMNDNVLEIIIAKASVNGHQILLVKTPSNNSIIVIASNLENINLQPFYRDILKVLFL